VGAVRREGDRRCSPSPPPTTFQSLDATRDEPDHGPPCARHPPATAQAKYNEAPGAFQRCLSALWKLLTEDMHQELAVSAPWYLLDDLEEYLSRPTKRGLDPIQPGGINRAPSIRFTDGAGVEVTRLNVRLQVLERIDQIHNLAERFSQAHEVQLKLGMSCLPYDLPKDGSQRICGGSRRCFWGYLSVALKIFLARCEILEWSEREALTLGEGPRVAGLSGG